MVFTFLQEAEHLTIIQWLLRAIITFIFLLFATKVMGERAISQLNLIDFTIALQIGNIMARPLSDSESGLKGPLITTSALIVLYLTATFLSNKWGLFRKWAEPSPYPLIKNGEIIYRNLKKARITIDHLLSSSRKQQINDLKNVALAQWEPDGSISFFLTPQERTVTLSDLQLQTTPFAFTEVVIKEGIIVESTLHTIQKTNYWLNKKLLTNNVTVSEVLLATYNSNDEFKIYLYK